MDNYMGAVHAITGKDQESRKMTGVLTVTLVQEESNQAEMQVLLGCEAVGRKREAGAVWEEASQQ